MAYETLNKSLPIAPSLRLPNDQLPFVLSPWDGAGNDLGVLTPKHRDHHHPTGYRSQQVDAMAGGYPPYLRAIPATAPWGKATEEFTTASPLTIPVLHVVEALLNSPHTQHFPDSHLTSYEILLVTTPHLTLSGSNSLHPATLLPSFT